MRKEHKKMYKAGKRWVVATIAFISLGIVSVNEKHIIAQADSNTGTNSLSNNEQSKAATSSTATSGTSNSASQSSSNETTTTSSSAQGTSGSSNASSSSSTQNGTQSSTDNTSSVAEPTSSNSQDSSLSTNTSNDSSDNHSLSLDLRIESPENNNPNINQSLNKTNTNNNYDVTAQLTNQVPTPTTTVTISKNQNSTSLNITDSGTSPYPQTVHLYSTSIYASPNDINTIVQHLNHDVNLSINQNNLNTPDSAIIVSGTENANINQLVLDALKYQVGNDNLKNVPLKNGDNVSFNLGDSEFNNYVNFSYVVMSTPVIKVNYVDDSNNVISTKYLTADDIKPGKTFQTNLNINNSGYQFTKGNDKIYSNYTGVDYNYTQFNNNDVFKVVNSINQSSDSNDSNLTLSYLDNKNATLNGVFASLGGGAFKNNDNSQTYTDSLINEIDIPVEKVPEQPSKPNTPTTNQNNSTPIQTFPTDDTYEPTYNKPAFSSANTVVSSVASSSASSSSNATSASTQYYEMYNYKTRLVKRNGTIHIFIQPRYTDRYTNDNLKNRDVVSVTNDNGKVTHDQEVTLDQYNAMLSASGKETFTTKQIKQAYVKRHRKYGIMRDKTHKTTFISPITKQGNNVLIDTNDNNHGFYSTKDHYLVKDTDELRVKIPKHVDKHLDNKKHHHRKVK